jgi:hypothetical protein
VGNKSKKSGQALAQEAPKGQADTDAAAAPCPLKTPVKPVLVLPKNVVVVRQPYLPASRRTVALGTDKPFTGKGKFTCQSDCVKFYKSGREIDARAGALIDGAGTGVILDVEAVKASAFEGVEMSWRLEAGAEPVTGDVETAKLTAIAATIDLHKQDGTTPLSVDEKSGDGRTVHKQNAAATRGRAYLTVKCEPADWSGTLTLAAVQDNVKLFDQKTAGVEVPLPTDLAVGPGKGPFRYWVQGQRASAAKADTGFALKLKTLGDQADLAKMTVVETALDLYTSPPTGAPARLDDAAKLDPGRLLLLQNAAFERKRTKLAVIKKPKDAPCKLVLQASAGAGKVALFPRANERHATGETAVALPKDIAAGDITDESNGLVFWIDGKDLSAAQETVLQLDVDGVDEACDKVALTVVDLRAENGTDAAPKLIPVKNKVTEDGDHYILKVKLVHSACAGAASWSSTSAKVDLADQNTDTVKVTAKAAASAGLDAEKLEVVFTPSGKTAFPALVHPMSVVKVQFSESANQSYGYDDMDDAARATAELHHVSVKKSGNTKIRCVITGGATSEMLSFTSDDGTTADVTAPASGLTDFDLVVNGKSKDAAEAVLNARVNGATGQICEKIKVDVYKEKSVSITVYQVEDSRYAGTSLTLGFDAAATETAIKSWYKRAVATIAITDGGTKDVAFDANGNAKLDIVAGGGASPELNTIKTAVAGAGMQVYIVRTLSWLYKLTAASSAGDDTITLATVSFIVVGDTYPVGSGATRENVTVQAVDTTTKVVTLTAPLTKNHAIGDALEWPLSGLSGNPILVQEAGKNMGMLQRTIGHEVGHSALKLRDIVQATNLMHFSAARTDTRLRYLKLTLKYSAGDEEQWEKCDRS